MTALAVVIVNFHGARLVADAVASLDATRVARVVVVDNSEDARERAALEAIGGPIPLAVVDAGGNVGFGAAVNLGVTAAAQRPDDYVWVLNPDVVVAPGAEEVLLGVLETRDACVASPVITHDDEPPTWWYRGGSFDPVAGRVEHDGLREPVGAAPGDREVSFMTGAAMMFSLRTWQRLGGLRGDLFLYWEDVELSIRAARRGVTLLVCGDAVVHHRVGAGSSGGSAASSGMSALFYYYNARNRVRVMRDVYGARSLLGAPALLESARLLARPVRHERGAGLVRKTWSGCRGLVAGLTEPTGPRREPVAG